MSESDNAWPRRLGWSLHTPNFREGLAYVDSAVEPPWYVGRDPAAAAEARGYDPRAVVRTARIASCAIETAGHDQRSSSRRPASNIPRWALLETGGGLGGARGGRRHHRQEYEAEEGPEEGAGEEFPEL